MAVNGFILLGLGVLSYQIGKLNGVSQSHKKIIRLLGEVKKSIDGVDTKGVNGDET